jgi:hypothetical protein
MITPPCAVIKELTAMRLRQTVRFVGIVLLLLAFWIGLAARNDAQDRSALQDVRTCHPTGGGELRVCHAAQAEWVFYQPSRWEVAYNTQVIATGGGRYATVLHGESRDMARYRAETGRFRPGDAIKTGIVDAAADPNAGLRAPTMLDFRIWGSLTNPGSPLYSVFDPSKPGALGLSGGGNPMVARGRRSVEDPYYYMFFLGVGSDGLHGTDWRNILLEARTRDFERFDLLQQDAAGHAAWVAFSGDTAMPAAVTDITGRAIQSHHPAPVETGASGDKLRPAGAVVTAGVFGSISLVNGIYHYFYTDQDAADPLRNHLYVRTARDISTNGAWSAPTALLDMPPEILVRVVKARGMDRWVISYNCLRSVSPFVSDICLQYTRTLDLTGPDGLGSLSLFDGPTYTGRSQHALGLIGRDRSTTSGDFLKIQQFAMTDAEGNLTVPPGRAGEEGGLVTWTDLSRDFNIFGAPVYMGSWDVTPLPRSPFAPPPRAGR